MQSVTLEFQLCSPFLSTININTMPLSEDVGQKSDCKRSFPGSGGYLYYSAWALVSITIFNAILALLFLIPAMPLMLVIGLVIQLKDKGPVFYKGPRIGLGKRQFNMYKFRTLPIGAQAIIGTDILRPHHFKLGRFTKFLRDSRLDELPQLFNILKGEMDFIGPRPVRPEVYEKIQDTITDYDIRFSVRPGLIGYAQLFTPHSAPKRLRAIINNLHSRRERRLIWDLQIISYTVWIVIKISCKNAVYHLTDLVRSKVLHSYNDYRELERVHLSDTKVTIETLAGSIIDDDAILTDLNERHFKLLSDAKLDSGQILFKLQRTIHRGKQDRHKCAKCRGTVFRNISGTDHYSYGYIIEYEPETDLNRYKVEQYFLKKSIV